jgi:hypothetical protein
VPLAAALGMAEGRTDWQLEVARNIGHSPMLEAPEWTALRIGEWLAGDVAAARESAARPAGSASTVR